MQENKEHLLITFPLEDHLLKKLKEDSRFSQVSYYPTTFVPDSKHPQAQWNHEPPNVPDDVWRSTTVQLTMFHLPPSAAHVPRLRLIQCMSAGVEHLLSSLEKLRLELPDLLVASASGVHSTTIAEYSLMYLLAQRHRMSTLTSIQANQSWARGRYVPAGSLSGCSELRGQVMGVLGYGSIGREVARLASAFGMTIHAATSSGVKAVGRGYTVAGSGDPEGAIPTKWFKSTDATQFKQFLGGLDVLVIACPCTPATENKLNTETIACLSARSILINVARGPIVNHDALVEALEGETLGGAILDVTVPEPLPPNHKLWSVKNCVVTPHIAGAGQLYSARCVDLLSINVARLNNDQQVINAIDVLKGY